MRKKHHVLPPAFLLAGLILFASFVSRPSLFDPGVQSPNSADQDDPPPNATSVARAHKAALACLAPIGAMRKASLLELLNSESTPPNPRRAFRIFFMRSQINRSS